MIKGNATSEFKNILKYDQLEVLSINSTHEVTHAVLKYIFFACTLFRTIYFRLSYTSRRLSFCNRSLTDKRSPVPAYPPRMSSLLRGKAIEACLMLHETSCNDDFQRNTALLF